MNKVTGSKSTGTGRRTIAGTVTLAMAMAAFAAGSADAAGFSGFRSSGGGYGMGGGGRGPMADGPKRPGGGDGGWGPRHPRPHYPSGRGGWVEGGGYDPEPVMIDEYPDRPPARRKVKAAVKKPVATTKPVKSATRVPPPQKTKVVAVPRPKPVVAAVDPNQAPGEVLFEVRGPEPIEAIDRLAGRYGLSRMAYLQLDLTGSTIYRYTIGAGRSRDAAERGLRSDRRVASVQPNFLFRLQDAKATGILAGSQYATAKLRLGEAHRVADGEGTIVAIIDSGVDSSHPELAGAVSANVNALSSDQKADPHGTGIAGIIAGRAQLTGVAPRTRLVAIRAFAPGSGKAGAQGTTFDVVRAISIAAQAGARVVNMSFAGPRDALLGRAIAAGHERGMVFVAAAGNAGATAPPSYPAAEPGVIAVTATDAADRLFPAANRGAFIGMAAPGVDILVAAPGGAYGFSSGTSLAAAHVSGVVALMLQRDGRLAADEVRRRLVAHASDLGRTGPDPEFGAGLVDAFGSLEIAPAATADIGVPEIDQPQPAVIAAIADTE